MSSSETKSIEAKKKTRRILSWIFHLTMILTAVIAIGTIWNARQETNRIESELRSVREKNLETQSKIATLKAREKQLKDAKKETALLKKNLRQIYAEYRNEKDIAENPSDLIISSNSSKISIGDTIRFSLPNGKHQLQIDISKLAKGVVLESKQLKYDLPGDAGYQLLLDHWTERNRKESTQLKLVLTSNSDEFESVSEEIFKTFAEPNRTESFGSQQRFAFPNQYELRSSSWLNDESSQPGMDRSWNPGSGFQLAAMRWSVAPKGEEPFKVAFDIRIVSEGPDIADPNSAGRLQTKYIGNGKFEILKKD